MDEQVEKIAKANLECARRAAKNQSEYPEVVLARWLAVSDLRSDQKHQELIELRQAIREYLRLSSGNSARGYEAYGKLEMLLG